MYVWQLKPVALRSSTHQQSTLL